MNDEPMAMIKVIGGTVRVTQRKGGTVELYFVKENGAGEFFAYIREPDVLGFIEALESTQ